MLTLGRLEARIFRILTMPRMPGFVTDFFGHLLLQVDRRDDGGDDDRSRGVGAVAVLVDQVNVADSFAVKPNAAVALLLPPFAGPLVIVTWGDVVSTVQLRDTTGPSRNPSFASRRTVWTPSLRFDTVNGDAQGMSVVLSSEHVNVAVSLALRVNEAEVL